MPEIRYSARPLSCLSVAGCFFLLFLLTYPAGLCAQSSIRLMGVVLDASTQAPIPTARVTVTENGWFALTDEQGQFFLEHLPPGRYTLQIKAPGYQAQVLTGVEVRHDLPVRLWISLLPEALVTDTVRVVASLPAGDNPLPAVIVLEGEQLRAARQGNLRQLLEQVAGLVVEMPGGNGTPARIRLHGSRSSQVLVLLDGQRLNLPATGEVDLNQIPLQQLERVEIVREGDYVSYGSHAYAGVIRFVTRPWVQQKQLLISGQLGSFRSGAARLALDWTRGRWAAGLQLSRHYSGQNFAYQYQGQTIIRQNAWQHARQGYLKIGLASGAGLSHLSLNVRESRRGLPSAYFNEMDPAGAWAKERWLGASLQHRLTPANGFHWQGLLGWQQVEQEFVNTAAPAPVLRYHNRQTNHLGEFRLDLQGQFRPGQRMLIGVQAFREGLVGENFLYPALSMGRHWRTSLAGFANFSTRVTVLGLSGELSAGVRLEKYFRHPWQGFPRLAFQLAPLEGKKLTLSTAWGRAARYPDFNSLFWKGDARAEGNPELQPEKKQYWNLGLRWQADGKFYPHLSILFYQEALQQLIFWHRRFDGIWQPRNEDRVRKKGLDLDWHQQLGWPWLRLQVAYSRIHTVNLSPEPNRKGRRIVFIPDQTAQAALTLQKSYWQVQLQFRYVGRRETLPANSPGSQLAPYRLWNLSFSLQPQWKTWQWELNVQLENLFNEPYQLIFGYPMPGRSLTVQVTGKLLP